MSHPSPPTTPLPTYGASPLAAFTARVCHTLWHGASSLLTIDTAAANALPQSQGQVESPRLLYQNTPPAFIHLVHRTLHPHHSPHIAATALLYAQRYITALHPSNSSNAAPPLRPAPGSEARIWCTALLVTIKQHDDRAAASRLWQGSRVEELAGGGLGVMDMVAMEKEFLRQVQWRLGVGEDEYRGWVQRLARFKAVMEITAPVPMAAPVGPASTLAVPTGNNFHVRRGSAQSTTSTVTLASDREDDEFDEDEDIETDDAIYEEDSSVVMTTTDEEDVARMQFRVGNAYGKEYAYARKRSVTVDPDMLVPGASAQWYARQ